MAPPKQKTICSFFTPLPAKRAAAAGGELADQQIAAPKRARVTTPSAQPVTPTAQPDYHSGVPQRVPPSAPRDTAQLAAQARRKLAGTTYDPTITPDADAGRAHEDGGLSSSSGPPGVASVQAATKAPAPKYTPLEQQVVQLKRKHPGVVLLIEVGGERNLACGMPRVTRAVLDPPASQMSQSCWHVPRRWATSSGCLARMQRLRRACATFLPT